MSCSYAEPDPTAVGLRALVAAVAAYRAGRRDDPPGRPRRGIGRSAGPPGQAALGGAGWMLRNTGSRSLTGTGSAGSESPDAAAPDPAPAGGGGSDSGADGWRLVQLAQAGDREAFGQLYDRYLGLVFRYAYHRLGDRALAEDVTSETFLRALRRIGSISYQGRDVGAWFVTITRNLVLDHVKSGRYRLEVTAAELPEPDRLADGPESTVLAHLTNATLLRCVRQLGAEQQECVVLRFLHGLSVAETAEIMGKNEGAIKALQHRAIRRLAALLPEDPR